MGVVIALIIGLAIGASAIFFWQKSKMAAKEEQIREANRQIDRLTQDYESRMQQSIASLQKDYEQESRQKIEAVKKQYNSKFQEIQQSHQAQMQKMQSLESSRDDLSLVKQKYEQQIQDRDRQIYEYEQQIKQLSESLSSQEQEKAVLTDQQANTFNIVEPDEDYLHRQEQLSEEAMEELMQLLDDNPHNQLKN
jgi:chromosome segregation ATPase